MKTQRTRNKIGLLLVLAVLPFLDSGLRAQTVTYTFTTCGASGRFGPTQAQISSAYAATNLSLTTSTTPNSGIQTFTVPASGLYRIDAAGASGGNTTTNARLGGFAARVVGEYNLLAGDVLKIIVGQMGPTSCGTGGGGGYSIVQKNGNILHAAGGGGGASSDNNGANATIISAGASDNPAVSNGGTNGSGGLTCQSQVNNGGGGGGYLGNGQDGSGTPTGYGGLSFVNGGTGAPTGNTGADGGFGGGGSGTNCTCGGGGGGGYSGGAGGQQVGYCNTGVNRSGGGGGGSWNTGANQVNTILASVGDGTVILTSLCNISLVSTANPICIGSTVQLSTNAASGILWSNNTSGNSITVTPTVTTTYSVSGTSTANCIASSALVIVVKPLPVIAAVVTPTTLCVGATASVTASGADTYTLNNGNSGTTTTVSPVVSTIYTLTGTSIFGCVNSNTVLVPVNSNSLTVTSNTTLCNGNSITLSASGAITYSWNTGGLFSVLPVSPTVSTTYTVNATDIFNCPLSKAISVTVLSPPSVLASASKTSVCKGESVTLTASGANTYTWNTGFVGSSVSYTLPVDIQYYYTVTGTDANGCTKTANIAISVFKCLGINELGGQTVAINVQPNPSSGFYNISLDNVNLHLNVKIYNALGMLIKTQDMFSGNNQLDLQSEKAGIYFLNVDQDGILKTIKLIKE